MISQQFNIALTVRRVWLQVPKLIHPLPPYEPRTPRSDAEDIEEEPPTPHPFTVPCVHDMILDG